MATITGKPQGKPSTDSGRVQQPIPELLERTGARDSAPATPGWPTPGVAAPGGHRLLARAARRLGAIYGWLSGPALTGPQLANRDREETRARGWTGRHIGPGI